MFSIIVKDQKLDTSGIRVNLYLKSTFPFTPDQGQIEGSFAFNGTLPNSPLNKRIFGFPHRLEGLFDLPINIPCTLTINARVWYDALISITSATEISLNFDLLIGYGSFASLIEGKTLKDLTFPDPIVIGEEQSELLDYADAQVELAYPAVNFNFPMIYSPNFYGDEVDTFLDFINHYNGGHFIENIITGDGTQNFNTLVPMLYLQYVTKLCFESFGYKPSGTFFDNPDIAKTMLFNNYSLDEKRRKYFSIATAEEEQVFFNYQIIEFDDDSTPPNEDVNDCFDVAAFNYEIKAKGEYCIAVDAMLYNPGIFIQRFLFILRKESSVVEIQEVRVDQLNQWLPGSVTFIQTFDDTAIGEKLSVEIVSMTLSNDIVEGRMKEAVLSVENWDISDLNRMTRTIDLKNHVPEKDISAFLVNLQLIFGIIIGFDHEYKLADVSFVRDALLMEDGHDLTEKTVLSSKKVTIVHPEGYTLKFAFDSSDDETKNIAETVDLSNFIGEFTNFADLPVNATLNNVAYVLNTNCYYIFTVVDGPGPYWNLLCHYHPPYVFGDGKNEVTPEMSPLLMYRHPGTRSIYPILLQKGTSIPFNGDTEDCELRFFFYHGLYLQTTFENYYPFASSLNYDPRGNSIGDFDLVFGGTRGIFNTFLSDYYHWLTNLMKQAFFHARMSFTLLKTLDLQRIYRIFNSRFLIKEAKVSISEKEMAEVEIDCRKV